MTLEIAPGLVRARRGRLLALALVLAALLLAAPPAHAAGCKNEAIRQAQAAFLEAEAASNGTQAPPALPDCRAYELVSPPGKENGQLNLNGGGFYEEEFARVGVAATHAAAAGGGLAWTVSTPLPGLGAPGLQLLSTRSNAEGWQTEDVIPRQGVSYGLFCPQYSGVISAFSPDLSAGVLADGAKQGPLAGPRALAPENPFSDASSPVAVEESSECGPDEPPLVEGEPRKYRRPNLFLRASAGGSYRLINVTPPGAPAPPVNDLNAYHPASFLAAGRSFAHVVFEEELPLTADAPTEPEGWGRGHDDLYEWSGATGTVRLVSVLPGGTAVDGTLAGSTRNGREGVPKNIAGARHAVSEDGSRVFFQANGDLYVREHAEREPSASGCEAGRACTVQIDASEVSGGRSGGGLFQAASADGSKVFFADAAPPATSTEAGLTSDTVKGSGMNLYECELPPQDGESCKLHDLTVPAGGIGEAGALGVVGAGEAGARLYFVAKGVLTATGAPAPEGAAAGAAPIPGQPNLYLHEDSGTTETTRFIAALKEGKAGDLCDWSANTECAESPQALVSGSTARVSEDGRFLAFDSVGMPTGYLNLDAGSHGLDDEIYLYDAEGGSGGAGSLSCASCNREGKPPSAPAYIPFPAYPNLDISFKAAYPQRSLAGAGRLFFDSAEALVAGASAGRMNVYEYEPAGAPVPQGAEACGEASPAYSSTDAGCIYLIAAGAPEAGSFFLDASADGSEVFFASVERLLGAVEDHAYDIYVARTDGGFEEPPPVPTRCASEESCRGPAASVPTFQAPASALFAGPGNPRAPAPPKPKPLTRAQKLARALKACHGEKSKPKRKACEKAARRKYGPLKKPKRREKTRGGRRARSSARRGLHRGPAAQGSGDAQPPPAFAAAAAQPAAAQPRASAAASGPPNAPALRPRFTRDVAYAAPTTGSDPSESCFQKMEKDQEEHLFAPGQYFYPGPNPPLAVTCEATEVHAEEATLNGELRYGINAIPDLENTLIETTECEFEYASSEAGPYTPVECEPDVQELNEAYAVKPHSATPEVHATPGHLQAGAHYWFRLKVKDKEEAEALSQPLEPFTTLLSTTAQPPAIDLEWAVATAHADVHAATLKAEINPYGPPLTSCEAQWVAAADFNGSWASAEGVRSAPCPTPLPEGLGDKRVEVPVAEGLVLNRVYRMRFLAQNAAGPAGESREASFRTYGIEAFSLGLFEGDLNLPLFKPTPAPGSFSETGKGKFEPCCGTSPPVPSTAAGGHPYELSDRFALNRTISPQGTPEMAAAGTKDVLTTLPPGLLGDPTATPRCEPYLMRMEACPGAAQVGVAHLYINQASGLPPAGFHGGAGEHKTAPIFNVVPPQGVPAQFGFQIAGVTAYINAGLSGASSYSVQATAPEITTVETPVGVSATFWGVPEDESHDAERYCSISGHYQQGCAPEDRTLLPLLRNPTSCSPARASTAVDSWQAPGSFAQAESEGALQMQGCDAVPFAPEFTLSPTTTAADSPAGLHVDLHLPQPQGPTELGEADLRKAVVTLPAGLNVNPSSADGLLACSESQIGYEGRTAAGALRFSSAPASCPNAAKIGAVEITTPLLSETEEEGRRVQEKEGHPVPRVLHGSVYLAQQGNAGAAQGENPFGSLLALYLVIEDPQTGIVVKLAGKVRIGPDGQLTTTFDQNPQLPFEDFKLDFFAGPRAALRTPATCGAFTTTTDLTPWTAPAGADATPSDSFAVSSGPNGSPCVNSAGQAPNSPDFQAGTLTPQAGAHSPFVLHLARADGSQEIRGVSATLPPGLTGKLAGVPYCSEQEIESAATRAGRYQAAHPDCPAASQVGTVDVAAGAGPQPFHVQGKAYLAGPYNGAPLSLAIVTPAVAGPFDLGTVVVKTALYVNPETAQIHAVSGPIPTMLEGIPLDVRSIAVSMDRPNFSLNPTSCEPMSIAATALSTLDQAASLSNRFQVGGCDALPFAPKLALSLKGPTKRTGHPALKAVLTAQPGEANIAAAQVTLPHSEFLDQGHIKTICTKVQFNEGGGNGERCPAGSVYGVARAETPLLDHPLEGPVYLRSSSHELPDLVVALGGQIDVVLDGRVDSVKGQIRNTFEVVPDAPVSQFTLEMQGGAKGLLQNSEDICTGHPRAIADFTGQNGKVSQSEPVLEANCPKKRKKHRRHHKHHRHHR